MKQIQKIMVPCDFSRFSDQSLNYAAELAQSLGAVLIIVNVINQRDLVAVNEAINQIGIMGKKYSVSIDSYTEELQKERSGRMDDLLSNLPYKDLTVKKIIKIGMPFHKLIQTIQEEHADIVVMGTKGRGFIAESLFGSTAEKMFRHCPVPLLTIRHQEKRNRDE